MLVVALEIFALCLILFLPFLYETNHVFRYYFRFFIYGFVVMFNSVFLMPFIMLRRPCDPINLITASRFCSPVSRVLGLNFDLRGREYLQKQETCIIVSNHQSSLDVLGLFHLWPIMGRCTVIARREVFYFWPFGLAAYFAGLIFINRGNTEKAKNKMDQCVTDLKTTNTKLWVFPEGTRRNTGEIHDFKKGAFHVAIKGQVPIMPVVFSSYRNFLDIKTKKFTPGHIIINALPPIQTTGMTPNDVLNLIDQTRKNMNESYKNINDEIEMERNLQAKKKMVPKSMDNNTKDNNSVLIDDNIIKDDIINKQNIEMKKAVRAH